MIIKCHHMLLHIIAENTQVYGRCSLSGMDDLAACVDVFAHLQTIATRHRRRMCISGRRCQPVERSSQ